MLLSVAVLFYTSQCFYGLQALANVVDNSSFMHHSHLSEEIYKKPVIVYNYPKAAKPFYVRLNDDGKTVAAFDMIVPKVCSS